MKLDFDLEPKDYIKILAFVGAFGASVALRGEKTESAPKEAERLAVLETKVEAIGSDVKEIKGLVIRSFRGR